jgi:hypothetical protein
MNENTLNLSDRTRDACGGEYKEEPNTFHHHCHGYRKCEACGSEFIVSYRKVLPVKSKTTEIRCLSCLHLRKVVKP